ncbi:MAG: hypothetical protein RMJ67_02505 [Elusimicrobiota bacterium]|nr:hypothetical protein [Endomicrobiia bacterium]MCX7911063.1 hypothetical protein [Endomicrobiia bacterium]MDW8165368.1 hypothetical protein [Elusimicrobiota bacterium]
MEKKTTNKITKRIKNTHKKYEITIDYPKNEEVITYKDHYAIRIGTPNNDGVVEISIDNSEFQRCRHSVGYWWYDWCNIPSGTHTLVARLVDPIKNRTLKKSEKVICIVK